MSEETNGNVGKRYTDPITGKFAEGNPGGGRPPGSVSVVAAIKKKLEECPEGKEKTYLQYLVDKVFKKAVIDEDTAMIKDIIDRVDGKPKESMDLTSAGQPLPIIVERHGESKENQTPSVSG